MSEYHDVARRALRARGNVVWWGGHGLNPDGRRGKAKSYILEGGCSRWTMRVYVCCVEWLREKIVKGRGRRWEEEVVVRGRAEGGTDTDGDLDKYIGSTANTNTPSHKQTSRFFVVHRRVY